MTFPLYVGLALRLIGRFSDAQLSASGGELRDEAGSTGNRTGGARAGFVSAR